MNALQTIEQQIYAIKPAFEAVAINKSISFEREAGFAIQVIAANDYSMKIAKSNPQSVVNAVTNISAIGISLNPAKKQAYLVPRDGKICLDISYMGLMDLAIQSGSILWAQSEAVHKNDVFKRSGFDRPPVHEFQPFSNARGEIIGVYVVVKTHSGDYLTHTMDLASVHKIRDRSSAWKAWIKDQRSCPWVTDEIEMIKKTCVKQAYKYWPKTDQLDRAIHYLNTDGGEGLDFESHASSAPAPLAEAVAKEWSAKAAACRTEAELATVWKEGSAELIKHKDRDAFASFKTAVAEQREFFAGGNTVIEGKVVNQ